MPAPQETRILLLGDTHSGNKDYPWGNFNKKNWLHTLSPVIANEGVGLIVHTGDFTDQGNINGAKRIANVLLKLNQQGTPTIGVEGNHDPRKENMTENRKILEQAGVIFVDEGEPYTDPQTGIVFIGDTNFTGGMGRPDYAYQFDSEEGYEEYGEAGLLHMKSHIAKAVVEKRNFFALTHFPPVVAEYRNDPQRPYPTDRNSSLGNVIEKDGEGFAIAVFHGHYHRGMVPDKLEGGTPMINTAVEHAFISTGRPYTVYRYPRRTKYR